MFSKKKLKLNEEIYEDSNDSLSESQCDSDVELQDALLEGRLKPGLHAKVPYKQKLEINNLKAIESKIESFIFNGNWSERLDLISSEKDLPPNINNPLNIKDGKIKSESDLDVIRNDIKREIKFMLSAKASVLKSMDRLHNLKIPTKKPTDYIAEMLKSEDHMNKIKKTKENKQEQIEKKEKNKLLREQKKMGKKIQQEVIKQRHKEKKEFQEKVKKFRKGDKESINFLDDDKSKNNKNKHVRKSKVNKKEFKQSKYGYGGRKKGKKRNTADSSASFRDFKPMKQKFK